MKGEETKKEQHNFNFERPLKMRYLDESIPLFDFTQIINGNNIQ